jgi:hypothetical protein
VDASSKKRAGKAGSRPPSARRFEPDTGKSQSNKTQKNGSFSLIERVILSAGAMLIFSVSFQIDQMPEGEDLYNCNNYIWFVVVQWGGLLKKWGGLVQTRHAEARDAANKRQESCLSHVARPELIGVRFYVLGNLDGVSIALEKKTWKRRDNVSDNNRATQQRATVRACSIKGLLSQYLETCF